MTGGFGIDAYYFSKRMERVIYIERDTDLFPIAQRNFQALDAINIQAINGDSIDFLKKTTNPLSWIYLDPSRRDEMGKRKIALADYSPNILKIRDLLLEKSDTILLKTSPMLDIQQAVRQLGKVEKAIILAIQNEVKEVLFLLKKRTESNYFSMCRFTKE